MTVQDASGIIAYLSDISSLSWTLNGNTVGALKYIGTNDAFDFPIYTNGLERARILSANGNVGIGTILPKTKLDVSGGSIRSTGPVGASGDAGVEIYNAGIKLYDYSLGIYSSSLDIDALSIDIRNQGIYLASFVNNGFIIGKTGFPSARVDVWGSNNANGTYALRVNSAATYADILSVQNGGRVGVNTTNSFALSVQPVSGSTGQMIMYSPAFNVSLQISDTDAASLGAGTATIMGSLRVDRYTGNVAIGTSPMSGNRLFVHAPTITEQTFYVDSSATTGNAIIGFTAQEPYLFFTSPTLGNSVYIKASGDSFINNGGKFGFGTNSPIAHMDNRSSGTLGFRMGYNTSALLFGSEIAQWDDSNGAFSDWSFVVASNGWPTMNLCSTGGSLTSPSVSNATNNYGELNAWGFGSTRQQTSNIYFQKDGTPSGTSLPSAIGFYTTAVGSLTPAIRMTIKNDGKVGINIAAPTAQLHVSGDFKTADPTSGAGAWMLGKVIAAAVVLDTANYVEVKIDGVLKKVGLVV
jgi:hypothetical protein